jgi:hypothetical protein
MGGAASVQEALALAGVAVRLLRDGATKVTLMHERPGGGATYRVEVDPGRASIAPSAGGSDETIVVAPRRLAWQLAPLEVEVGADGLIRALALELRGFRPVVFAAGLRRTGRGERVAVRIDLGDFGRALSVQSPHCIAME